MSSDRLRNYAELAVRVGANVGEGQYVLVDGLVEHAPLVRALAEAAYAAGARFVDARYADLHVRHAMIDKAPEETLRFTPPWMVQRLEQVGAESGAQIIVVGNPEPELFADLDQERVGRAQQVAFNEAHLKNVTSRAINWSLVAYPNESWAETVYGEPDLDRLWADVATAVRLDEPDPVAAWDAHIDRLETRAGTLNEARFDAIRFAGPGTELVIGLLPGSRWATAAAKTAFGRRHVVNLPTEEVYTTPDPGRAEGVVRATTDLALAGRIVRGLELRFENGKVVDANAEAGVEVVRGELEADEGASHLGEVALVDNTSRVGQLGRVFLNGLFDENASSHLAYGNGFPYCVEGEDEAAVNESSIHTDVMIGGPAVDAFGLNAQGDARPIILHNEWQLA
jgi:aminopeptidase